MVEKTIDVYVILFHDETFQANKTSQLSGQKKSTSVMQPKSKEWLFGTVCGGI